MSDYDDHDNESGNTYTCNTPYGPQRSPHSFIQFYENDTARYPLRTTFFIESLVPPPRIRSFNVSLHYQCFSATAFFTIHWPKTNRLPDHSTTLSNASLETSPVLGHN
jgi:hypothetical protein